MSWHNSPAAMVMETPTEAADCKLQFSSYNVRGLPKHNSGLLLRPDILETIQLSDIICLQETWYSKQDLPALNELHSDFHGHGVSTVDYRDGLIAGHPPGGVAILWNKRLDSMIKPVDINCDFAAAIEVQLDTRKFIVINVYMPYQCDANEDRYLACLGTISSAIDEFGDTCFAIMGDWNANLREGNSSMFAGHLHDFCRENSYVLSSKIFLPDDSYTYVSCAWGSQTWLDHVVTSSDFHNSICDMSILYDISEEDHIPVLASVAVDMMPSVSSESNESVSGSCCWRKSTPADIAKYTLTTDLLLRDITILEGVHCRDVNCTNKNHIEAGERMYSKIADCLKKSSEMVFPEVSHSSRYNKPGWSDYVKDTYQFSRDIFQQWSAAGKPRQGPLFELRKTSRAQCKYACRHIRSHENALRKESLAKKLCDRDQREFWKEIRLMNNSKTPLPMSIDGLSGEKDIADLWMRHYQKLFNCVVPRNFPNCTSDNRSNYDDVTVTVGELRSAIKDLACGKACGLDGIFAEHLKHSSERLLVLLSICLTCFFVHGALLDCLIDVVLVPVIKDKSGKISSSDNYRPIALASIVSKVIESVILKRICDYLVTHHNQFGFKEKLGTDQCIYVLKECIESYLSRNTSVFTCFLDASKAFDRVNHGILFEKLLRRGVPAYIVRLLMYWYAHQRVCVRWGKTYSVFFTVCNGVRQGGILSPLLFNVYVDDLSELLNICKIGCCHSGVLINHLMYADDLVLMAPSVTGLQRLIRVCEEYGLNHDIKFNAKKSAVMLFKATYLKGVELPQLRLDGQFLNVTQSTRYLGHIFTQDFTDDADISRQCRMLYAQGNIILRKFHMCSLDVKLKMFKSYCTPLYTAQLWSQYRKASINKLYIAYHNILKFLLGFSKYTSTSLLCTVFDVSSCAGMIRKYVYSFSARLERSMNLLVQSLMSSDVFYKSRLRKHWFWLLLV